jgi:hypothetical protein
LIGILQGEDDEGDEMLEFDELTENDGQMRLF